MGSTNSHEELVVSYEPDLLLQVTHPLSTTMTPIVVAHDLRRTVEGRTHREAVVRHQAVPNLLVAIPHPQASGDDSMPAIAHVRAPAALHHGDDSVVVAHREIKTITHFLSRTDRALTAPSQATRATDHLPASTPSCALIWPASSWKREAVSEPTRPSVCRRWLIVTTRRKRKKEHTARTTGNAVEKIHYLDFQGNPYDLLPITLTMPNLPKPRALSNQIHKAVTGDTKRTTPITRRVGRVLPTLRNDVSHSTSHLLRSWSPESAVLLDGHRARPEFQPAKTSNTANLEWDAVDAPLARTSE